MPSLPQRVTEEIGEERRKDCDHESEDKRETLSEGWTQDDEPCENLDDEETLDENFGLLAPVGETNTGFAFLTLVEQRCRSL